MSPTNTTSLRSIPEALTGTEALVIVDIVRVHEGRALVKIRDRNGDSTRHLPSGTRVEPAEWLPLASVLWPQGTCPTRPDPAPSTVRGLSIVRETRRTTSSEDTAWVEWASPLGRNECPTCARGLRVAAIGGPDIAMRWCEVDGLWLWDLHSSWIENTRAVADTPRVGRVV